MADMPAQRDFAQLTQRGTTYATSTVIYCRQLPVIRTRSDGCSKAMLLDDNRDIVPVQPRTAAHRTGAPRAGDGARQSAAAVRPR